MKTSSTVSPRHAGSSDTKRVIFDVQRLYYLPQYEPVMRALDEQGVECIAVARDGSDPEGRICRKTLNGDFAVRTVTGENAAVELARHLAPDWIIVGNGNPYRGLAGTRTALLYHGIGVKQAYYSPHLLNVDLRFVEGPYRVQSLAKRFPAARLEPVGFPKLDPLFNGSAARFDLAAHGLDAARPTLLYAPTFFPSSIERLPHDFPARLADCNIVIKPHQFSLVRNDYRKQQERFTRWAEYPNVFVAGTEFPNLAPFMASADVLISDASSALFEFAALDRPVIWCDFLKLRWSYRGPFGYRFRRRMDQEILRYADVGAHAASPADLVQQVRGALREPHLFSQNRRRVTTELIGATDGQAAARVAKLLIEDRSV